MIISIMMVPFFQMQSLVRKTEIRTEAKGQVADISLALRDFALRNGRYPLPANPRYPLNNNLSGAEQAITDVLVTLSDVCGLTAGVDFLVCKNGSRAAFGGAVNDANNRVVIGTVPYAVLGLNPSQSLDQYGNKLTYAVTYGLTKTATFDNTKGTIRVADQSPSNCLIKIDGQQSDGAHFVVISHGQNRRGAFPASGGGRVGTPASTATFEYDNTRDNDSRFRIISSRPDGVDPCTDLYPMTNRFIRPGENVNEAFDDMVAFRTSVNAGNWTAQTVPGAPNVYQSFLSYRSGTDNVVIGASAATLSNVHTLSAGKGQIQVEGGNNVKAGIIITDYICSVKNSGNNILRPDNFGDACFKITNLTDFNRNIGSASSLEKIIHDGAVKRDGDLFFVRKGLGTDDKGMMKSFIVTPRNVQAPRLAIKGVDPTGTVVLDECGTSGATGWDTAGRMKCAP